MTRFEHGEAHERFRQGAYHQASDERGPEMNVKITKALPSKLLTEKDADDWIAPFDLTMDRASVFIPAYMNRLLAMVAAKQGEGKAKFIRNAILRELWRYLEQVKVHNGGKYDPLPAKGSQLDVAADTENDEAWLRELYNNFANQDQKFPDPVQLHSKRR
jgi:hypothetical protein